MVDPLSASGDFYDRLNAQLAVDGALRDQVKAMRDGPCWPEKVGEAAPPSPAPPPQTTDMSSAAGDTVDMPAAPKPKRVRKKPDTAPSAVSTDVPKPKRVRKGPAATPDGVSEAATPVPVASAPKPKRVRKKPTPPPTPIQEDPAPVSEEEIAAMTLESDFEDAEIPEISEVDAPVSKPSRPRKKPAAPAPTPVEETDVPAPVVVPATITPDEKFMRSFLRQLLVVAAKVFAADVE